MSTASSLLFLIKLKVCRSSLFLVLMCYVRMLLLVVWGSAVGKFDCR